MFLTITDHNCKASVTVVVVEKGSSPTEGLGREWEAKKEC